MVSNALITPFDMHIELSPVLLSSLQDEARSTGYVVAGVLGNFAQMSAQHFGALWQNNTKLSQ